MKRFIAVILSVTLSIVAFGQELYPSQPQEEKSYGVGEFESLCVSDSFEVTLQEGRCGVMVNADKALMPYIQVYVRSGVLYIDMDEKSIPNDVKRIYRGKDAPIAITHAVVTAPAFAVISATQNAVLTSNGTVFADSLRMELTDKACVRNFKLEMEEGKLVMNKNSQAMLTLQSEKQLDVILEGKAQLRLQNKGNVLQAQLSGSSEASLAGEADTFSFTVSRYAHLESLDLKATRVKAEMNNGGHAIVRAEELLNVKLAGGSTLYYTGVPAIQIDEILKSTFAPYKPEAK